MAELPSPRFVCIQVEGCTIVALLIIDDTLLFASEDEWDEAIREAARRDIKPIWEAAQHQGKVGSNE